MNQQTTCIQCGTCCTNGGPALHISDREFVTRGDLPLSALYTIRSGEWVKDNVNGGFICAGNDIIKIKSQDGSSACRFYDNDGSACRIYKNRPIQCRVLKCWDTAAIVALHSKDLISRKILLSHIDGLWELVEAHASACDYARAKQLIDDRSAGNAESANALDEMIRYDESIRAAVSEKRPETLDMLDFIFGRPFHVTLVQQFGIRIHQR